MSTTRRLNDLERRFGGDDGRVSFEIHTPPPGLTAAEHDAWSAEVSREAAARGVYCFTLDLGGAVIQ